MRSRYLISAAVLVAAACIGRRREASAPAVPAAPACDEVPTAAEPPAAAPVPAEKPVAQEPAPAERAVTEPVVAERGRFALGGQALAPGHTVVAGITVAGCRDAPVGADALRLSVERAFNMPAGGLVVLSDPGFGPDTEGFTLALAAAAAGRFAASGTYELLAGPSSASTGGTAR